MGATTYWLSESEQASKNLFAWSAFVAQTESLWQDTALIQADAAWQHIWFELEILTWLALAQWEDAVRCLATIRSSPQSQFSDPWLHLFRRGICHRANSALNHPRKVRTNPSPSRSRRVKDAMAVSDRTLPRALGNLDSFKCNVELRSGIRLIAAGEQSNYRTLQCPKRIPSGALRAATSCERSSEGAPLDQLRFSLVFQRRVRNRPGSCSSYQVIRSISSWFIARQSVWWIP